MNITTTVRANRMLVVFIMGALVLSPISVFAKSDDRDDDNRGRGKSELVRSGKELSRGRAEAQIKEDGRVTLKDVQVTAVSGNTITAKAVWGGAEVPWNITTDGTTQFIDKKGRTITFADIVAGDRINMNGMVATPTAPGMAVKASVVRDLLVATSTTPANPSQNVFDGTVQAVSSSTTPATLTVLVGSVPHAVQVSSGTLILGKNWLPLLLSSFSAGDKVRVFGSLAQNASTTISALVVKNETR